MSLPSELLPVGLLGTGAAGGYTIDRSLRFNSSDSAYLSRTPASAGNRKTWTWAGWVKLGLISTSNFVLFNAQNGTSTGFSNNLWLYLTSNQLYVGDGVSDYLISNNKFRDPSAWYHIVWAVDTTQATATNRMKLYVNGTELTYATDARSSISQSSDTTVNSTNIHYIGRAGLNLGYFDGYFADCHLIDGQALDPTSFTEVDATTGQLIPIEYTGSYGPLVDQSEVWSNALSGSLKTPTAGFDANPYSGRSEGVGGLTFTPTTPIVFTDKVEVYDNNNVTKSRVNSGSYVQHASNAWVTVATGGGTITTMDFLRTDNPSFDAGFYAIRVDGKLLVDQGVTVPSNGFHLPFSDNSTAAALGTDTSGNGNDWDVYSIAVDNPTTLPGVGFDGTGDYLSLADNADFDLAGNDFTIEAFVYHSDTDYASYEGIIAQWVDATGSDRAFVFETVGAGASSDLEFYYYDTSNNFVGPVQGAALSKNRWHHVAVCRSGSSIRIFIDGVGGTASSINVNIKNSTNAFTIGGQVAGAGGYWNGYISNVRFVNGTALYTTNFTPPAAPLTNVTNTKLLCCQSSSSATAATVSPGTITANGNVYATTFTDSQPGNDSLVDTPTSYGTDTGAGGEVRGNYCTLNPLNNGGVTLTNGNLDWQRTAGGSTAVAYSTIAVSSGKWYFETTLNGAGGGVNWEFGVARVGTSNTIRPGTTANGWGLVSSSNTTLYKQNNNTLTTIFTGTLANGDIIGIALDLDNGRIWFARNNTWLEGSPSAGTGASYTNLSGTVAVFAGGDGSAVNGAFNAGARPFAYTAPSGFKALCDTNLPAPVVAQPSTVMDVVKYDGNGSTQTISGLGFSPDFAWIKVRNGTVDHVLYDQVRGVQRYLSSNTTGAEGDQTGTPNVGLYAFTSDGFSVGDISGGSYGVNGSSGTYVAWTWDAGSDENPTTNEDGSITSQVRANASAGFSVATFTGATTGTIGHGLGAAPSMIIMKARTSNPGADDWFVYHKDVGNTKALLLNSTAAPNTYTYWNNTSPTSTVFSIGSGIGTPDWVAYCFAPVSGYSSFGSVVGNGSADGPFCYTGFTPRWILWKNSSATSSWIVLDTARDTYNQAGNLLLPNTADAEFGSSNVKLDILSNGFKFRTGGLSGWNISGQTMLWAAFAESPFQYARAR